MVERRCSPAGRDRGDTLIEVLVAVTVISIAVVGLLGGLLTTTAASTLHRNTTTLDGVLRTFDSAIQARVDAPPASSPSSAPIYKRCATPASYQLAGSIYPGSQATGSPVSVPVVGLDAGAAVTAVFGTNSVAAGTTSSSGAAIATFTVPATTTAGSYPLTLQTVSTRISAGTITILAPGIPALPDLLAPGPYDLSALMSYWTGATFSTDPAQCVTTSTDADIQQLALTLTDSETGSGATDTTAVVLSNTSNLNSPTESIAPSGASVALGSNISFSANLSGAPTPTGSVTWSFDALTPSGTACDGGSDVTTVTSGAATCPISTAPAGSYTATGTYSGDSNWTGMASDTTSAGEVDSIVVNKGQPSMTTTGPSGGQTVGSTFQFTASLSGLAGGITPTGTVDWTFPAGSPTGASCSNLVGNSGPVSLTGTATCAISLALPGTYQPTATYSGDSNYLTASGNQASVTVNVKAGSTSLTSTPSNSAVVGSDVTFTDTVSGVPGITPTGTVTWTFPPGTPAGASCSNLAHDAGPLDSTGNSTCTVSSVQFGTYQPVATYGGDTSYNGSQDNTAYVDVGKETPTVNVSAAVSFSRGSIKVEQLTFTAQVIPLNSTDPNPTGTVTWAVTVNGSAVACAPSPSTLSNDKRANSSSTSCTVSPSSAFVTYDATADYGGDANYAPATGPGSSTG